LEVIVILALVGTGYYFGIRALYRWWMRWAKKWDHRPNNPGMYHPMMRLHPEDIAALKKQQGPKE
jgi:hypothetical protein